MKNIKNYKILEKIHETRNSIIYRGQKENDIQKVIIKLLKTKFPTPSEIARFKQEYKLIKKLDFDGIIKTYELVEDNNRYAIIEEDFKSISLKKLLKSEKPDLKKFLDIAVKTSEILGTIHKNNIIHLDIKPDNILINTTDGRVKITDFGISAALTHANDELYNPEVIEGTLTYMSPEQTGRMNRSIDYRTDLYSLGITFYELLTGEVPFNSKDPMELIHSHIARKPALPESIQTSLPSIVSEIITKLLSKNPEDRYQNAFGLASDVRECIHQLDEHGKIAQFELCKHDISNKFIIPGRLYGRDKEIETLISGFESVADSRVNTALMVVSGAPGIGKSSIINEIQKPIVARRGYFISGKYEQFRRDKPYSAIIQAFQALVKQMLSESEEKIAVWKKELLESLGTNGRVITEVIPEVELIIGKQPELPELGPEESKNRFNFVFENFTGVFLKKEHPVALFIDDVQWADLASLQFLKNILSGSDIHYLYLIISYRDNEVSETHLVMDFLKEAEKNNIKTDSITLGPLNSIHVTDLIVNFLKSSFENGTGLANLVHKKTGGNPFFVNQFLHTLYSEKLILLDDELGWQWDMELVNTMKVTDNIVEMLAGKIVKLSDAAREVMKICACIGNRFDLETLASVGASTVEVVLSELTEAIDEGLVSRLGDNFVFHHDRIQEAAYSLVTETGKSELHYKIGMLTLDTADETVLQNKLFYIADQLNLGADMIKSSGEREKLAQLNLEAGKKAKKSAAYEPAFRYLEFGIDLLEEKPWKNQYNLTLSLYTESTEAAYLMGDNDKMNEMAKTALQNIKLHLDKVKIYISMINVRLAQEDFQGVMDTAFPLLRLFGFKMPKNPTQLHVFLELMKVKFWLRGKKTENILKLPAMTDPKILAAQEIYSRACCFLS